MKKKIYYFDGYHGGQEGHMPLGAFRTILDFLEEKPEWKINLDVEPESWKLLKYRDPHSFKRLLEKIQEGRVEIVGETYSQPLTCGLNGESIIRNFVYGREALKRNLGDINVENYVAQEPTFTSCMPQILLSLGYKHASLFNSTVFAGYTQGVNSPVVLWKGNDGSEILTIPNYPINEIVKHENNGSTWWSLYNLFATPDYVQLCYDKGIDPPHAMCLQDLGHHAELAPEAKRDGIDRSYLEYITAKEYFEKVNVEDVPVLKGQELIRVGLAWSEKTLGEYLKATRAYEYQLLTSEILNAVSTLQFGMDFERDIRDCWKHFMLTVHHDVWVCTNHTFTESMRYQLYALDNQYRDLRSDLSESLVFNENDNITVTVFNPSQKSGRRLVELNISLGKEVTGCIVTVKGSELPAEVLERNLSVDIFEPLDAEMCMNNGCHKKILFYYDFKPFEFVEFELEPIFVEKTIEKPLIVQTDKELVFENDLVRIKVDLLHGGCISSYYDKIKDYEYVKENGYFNELKGYFDEDNRFVSNIENPAKILNIQSGANIAILRLCVPVASANVVIEYKFNKENAYLDVQTRIDCADNTKIGDPYKTDDWHDLHRTIYDIKYGFNAYFATSFEQKHLDKHCAFDVCRTQEESTEYNNVKEIKHNIAVNWLDVTDEQHGLAIFVDRTTSYTKEKMDEVGVSLLWGTDCSCIWSSDLSRVSRVENYRILPHEGAWEDADIWGENDAYNRQLCSFVGKMKKPLTLPFDLIANRVEVSAFFVENGEYYIRLFNYGNAEQLKLKIAEPFTGLISCSHDKKENSHLLQKNSEGIVEFSMRRFEIKTFKLSSQAAVTAKCD
jgi:alpha-mannosidase